MSSLRKRAAGPASIVFNLLIISMASSASAGQMYLVADEGEAYAQCIAHTGSFQAYWQNHYQTYTKYCVTYPLFDLGAGQGAARGFNHEITPDNGYPFSSNLWAYKVSKTCSNRPDTSLPTDWGVGQNMCKEGCEYSKTGTGTENGEPVDLFEPSGAVCSDPPPQPVQALKGLGFLSCPGGECPMKGNPINSGNGNKFQAETDIGATGLLGFSRYYNSDAAAAAHLLGPHWTNTYTRKVEEQSGIAAVWRPDGKQHRYVLTGGSWVPDADIVGKLQRLVDGSGALTGWAYEGEDARQTENYDALGRLISIARLDGESIALQYNGGVIEGNDDDYLLTSVTAEDGRKLVFTYDTSRRISTLTDAAGAVVTYHYDTLGRLAGADYPGGASKSYVYNESANTAGSDLPHALTGIVDEESQRFATFKYVADGRAVSTEHAGGVGSFIIDYALDGSATVERPSGAVTTEIFEETLGVRKVTGAQETQGAATRTRAYVFDVNGRIDLATDALGVTTDYDYDSRGLLTQRIENTANTGNTRRTTQTDWHSSFSLPTETRLYDSAAALPGTLKSRGTYAYNSRGQATAACQIDPSNGTAMAYTCGSSTNAPTGVRQSRMTYCESGDVTAGTCPRVGLLVSVDGPRTDVTDTTTYTYYASDDSSCASSPTTCPHRKGDLWKITNALGQISEILSYDATGRVLSTKDANGVVTDLEYNSRGWPTASKVRGTNNSSEADDSITRIEYDDTGAATKVTEPDGAYLSFTYDAAHRLTDVTDSLGNSLHYTLDNAGNRMQEDSKNSGGTVKRSLSRLYDTLGQLETIADAYSTPTDFTYDLNGQVDTVTDALGRISNNDYDALGRLTQSIANTAGSGAERPVTGFAYDARDHLTTVTDPKGLNTTYTYGGLDDLTQLVSPDTGTTTYAYDSAGNRSSQTDARGVTSSYSYDALGRLTAQTFPTTAQNMAFYYDTAEAVCVSGETFTAGRLTKFSDQSGSTKFCYDRRGNLVRKVQATGSNTYTTGATYDAADRVTALSYPSGAIVTYLRNANGQINRVDVKPSSSASQVTAVSAVTYLPFGPLNTLTFDNGRVLTKAYDQNYGIDSVSDSASTNPLSQDFTLDVQGNVTGLTERTNATTTVTRTYTYDGLDRLTAQKNGATTVEGFAYDATGNRTSKTVSGTTTYTYPSTSHQLTSIGSTSRSYDADGNLTQVGTGFFAPKYSYYDFGRMKDHAQGSGLDKTTTYVYNAKGERVQKSRPGIGGGNPNGTQFVYDEEGHLLGEYGLNGSRQKEYVWLGDTLVAIMQGNGVNATHTYVETDHLGTPRAVVLPSTNTIVWRWDLNPKSFGENTPNIDPDGDSTAYKLNLRFPGQYYDEESDLHYNYFRDYEPGTGRYVQSDPIGLGGGISTYGYVRSSPLGASDRRGLVDLTFDSHGTYMGEIGSQSFYVYPGDPTSESPRSTAAAVTIVKFLIDAHCKEVKNSDGSSYYTGDHYSRIHVYFEIYKRPELQTQWTDGDEQQHVDHYLEWIEDHGKAAALAAQEDLSGCNGDGPDDCVRAMRANIEDALAPTLGAKAQFTKEYYDDSGLHDHVK